MTEKLLSEMKTRKTLTLISPWQTEMSHQNYSPILISNVVLNLCLHIEE